MFGRLWILSLRNSSPLGRVAAFVRPCLAWIGAPARDRRGMSAVEFGLAAPVFLAMLTPVIDLGLAFSQQIRINQAVEAGAQYAAMNQYNTNSSTSCDSTKPWAACVSGAMTNATTLSVGPSVGGETCGCPNGTSTSIISHDTVSTCGPSNGGTTCSDGSTPGYYVTISASLTYTSVMPFSILGASTTLSSQAVVRVN